MAPLAQDTLVCGNELGFNSGRRCQLPLGHGGNHYSSTREDGTVSPRDERRMRRVRISRAHLTNVLLGGDPNIRTVTSDMPADARVEFTKDDPTSDSIVAFVSSKEWEPVDPSHEIPDFYPTYTVVTRR